MIAEKWYTVREVAEMLGVSTGTLRRILDNLDEEIPRVGRYHAISATLVEQLKTAVERIRAAVDAEPCGRGLLNLLKCGSKQAKA